MCEDEDDEVCRELRRAGYKSMSEMTEEETSLFEKAVAAIDKEFHVRFTARDLSVKKMMCQECGGELLCIHFRSEVKGRRHPDIMVDVDDFVEICLDCGIKRRSYDETYRTSPELRMQNCPYCNRGIDQGDLKVFNKTSY